jgi:hypothetical protein
MVYGRNFHLHLNANLEENLQITSNKLHHEYYCLKTSLCVWSDVSIVWWLCVLCLFVLDASIAEEDIEGEYYQEEEEYPGHFVNQGKPSFESYSKCLVLLLHSTCFK